MTATLSGVSSPRLTEELDLLFREHYALVYRTAYGVTGSRDDAQDVLQTIFLSLLRRKVLPDLKTNPKAYLYRSAVNLSLNTIRRRQHHVSIDEARDWDEVAQPRELSPAEAIHQRLYEAVLEFDAEAAEILILRYVHNYNVADIAGMLGKSRSGIAVRLFRLRARLKKLRAPQKAKGKS